METTTDEESEDNQFFNRSKGTSLSKYRESTESDGSSSSKENKRFLSKKIIKSIKSDRKGAIVDSGQLKTLSVGEIDQFDTKRYRYVEVKSKLLPKENIRVKLDYPLSKNIPKDILVPGNKYQIFDAKIFNLSKSTPSWVTLRPGRIKVSKTAKGYLSYKKYDRRSKRHSTDEKTKRKGKRSKYSLSSSISCSR